MVRLIGGVGRRSDRLVALLPKLCLVLVVILTVGYTVAGGIVRPNMYSDSGGGFVGWYTQDRASSFNHSLGPDLSDISREVEGFTSISNAYTIGADWTATSLMGGDSKVDFAKTVGDPGPAFACGAPERRAASYDYLDRHAGGITVRTMADLLRYTGEDAGYHPAEGARPTRVCMHAGPFESRFWQATGSLVSDVRGGSIVVWATGTSGPDCSVFKPIFFGVPMPDLGPMPRESDTPGAYWWRHERLHRRVMADYSAIIAELRPEIEALEDGFFREAEAVRDADDATKVEFVASCWRVADALEARWLARLETRSYHIAHPAYESMWRHFNAAAALEFA